MMALAGKVGGTVSTTISCQQNANTKPVHKAMQAIVHFSKEESVVIRFVGLARILEGLATENDDIADKWERRDLGKK